MPFQPSISREGIAMHSEPLFWFSAWYVQALPTILSVQHFATANFAVFRL